MENSLHDPIWEERYRRDVSTYPLRGDYRDQYIEANKQMEERGLLNKTYARGDVMWLVEMGYDSAFSKLLAEVEDTDRPLPFGDILIIAAEQGYLNIIKTFPDNSILADDYTWYALYGAAKNGHWDVIEYLTELLDGLPLEIIYQIMLRSGQHSQVVTRILAGLQRFYPDQAIDYDRLLDGLIGSSDLQLIQELMTKSTYPTTPNDIRQLLPRVQTMDVATYLVSLLPKPHLGDLGWVLAAAIREGDLDKMDVAYGLGAIVEPKHYSVASDEEPAVHYWLMKHDPSNAFWQHLNTIIAHQPIEVIHAYLDRLESEGGLPLGPVDTKDVLWEATQKGDVDLVKRIIESPMLQTDTGLIKETLKTLLLTPDQAGDVIEYLSSVI